MVPRCLLALWLSCTAAFGAFAEPVVHEVSVDGVRRTALVYPGANALQTPSPLVLAFHGLTHSAGYMAETTRLHEAWPEATVVYPQGLSVVLGPGWQFAPGDLNDRDVRFVDALLGDLEALYRVDGRRVYATGFSNGAIFTYVLLAARPDRLAAFAAVAGAMQFAREPAAPKPVLIIHGTADPLVPISWAVSALQRVLALNQCQSEVGEWAPGYELYGTCASGQPAIWHAHPGGHVWPEDATASVVRFFKEHALPGPAPARGDLNGDGSVSIGDVLVALQITIGRKQPTLEELMLGDLDGDGTIRIGEVLLILRASLGLETL